MTLRSDFTISTTVPEPPEAEADFTGATQHSAQKRGVYSLMGELPALNSSLGELGVEGEAPRSESLSRRVAMLVTHGMGQQVPYETLSAIAQALITQYTNKTDGEANGRKPGDDKTGTKAKDPKVNVSRVKLTAEEGAPELSRVEVHLKDVSDKPVDVHIYESYWAPLTEGQISFLQTVGFLLSAGWNGIWTCFISPRYSNNAKQIKKGHFFDRWMFGDFHPMRIKRRTLLLLFAIMVFVLLCLLPALAVYTPTGLSALKELATPYREHFLGWQLLTRVFALFGAAVFVALAYIIHYFVVEYVGDVAIYVSSYKVSRFDAIRNSILNAAYTVSRQIYSAGVADDHELPYDRVVIVGHSLGSVISYDLLNAAINWDQVECGFKHKVVERTTRLITFGSPLDKTAFLFRCQVKSGRNLREALAARQQPLIFDYAKFRPESFKWVNIYSPRDIISGHLDYYDIPDAPNRNPVENRVDEQARTLFLAHTQYWENEELHRALYEAVI
jgi:hypothetical protein